MKTEKRFTLWLFMFFMAMMPSAMYSQDGAVAGHNFVDLGLPSGTLWATSNVGTTEYGSYFSWGEIDSNSPHTWAAYKYSNGNNTSLTKYNSFDIYGTVDYKIILDEEDDVASMNWGLDWKMPTKAQFQELVDECIWTWTTQNGINGYSVEGRNGRTIFLPAAGFSSGNYAEGGEPTNTDHNVAIVFAQGGEGQYITSECGQYAMNSVEYFTFSSTQPPKTVSADRVLGRSVRPVLCSNIADNHTYVDLGLSSGTLWAKTNVGGTDLEAGETLYGDYFAWAETQPKSFYTQNNNKYYSGTHYEKYYSNYYSYGDGKTILELMDDAATANWGDKWKMPTVEQFNELLNSCSWVWATYNSVNGCKVIGPNGNYIFLPASGFRNETTYKMGINSQGAYLACEMGDGTMGDYVIYLDFKNGSEGTTYSNRYFGRSVRPVLTKDATDIRPIIENTSTKQIDIYSIDGKKISNVIKGINIINGKKVLVK